MSSSYSFVNILNSYDTTADVSNIKLTQSMVHELSLDYNKLKLSANGSPDADVEIIKRLDYFRKKMLESGLKDEIPDFLKNKGKVDLEKMSTLKKLASLKVMLKKIEVDIEKNFGNIDINFSDNFTISSSGNVDIIVDDLNTEQTDHVLNLDLKELFAKPALEVYAKLKDKINSQVCKMKGINQEVKSNDLTHGNDSAEQLVNSTKNRAIFILSAYLEEYLKKEYGSAFKNGDTYAIANLTAKEIVEEIEETGKLNGKDISLEDLDTYLGGFFDKELIEQAASASVEEFLETFSPDKISASRVSYFSAKAQLLEGESNVEEKNFRQLANSLIASNANYKNAVQSGFGQRSLKEMPIEQVKEMCEAYVSTFMKSQGLKPIPLSFNSTGSTGEFHSGEYYINVNLNKVRSQTDLYMTLSHEMTHAVDSVRNKLQGKSGLLNDISEDISGVNKNSAEGKVVKDLQRYCYLLNPNERNARKGELSALMFASEVNKKDGKSPAMLAEIKSSVASYVRYQNKTINATKEVKQYLETFEIDSKGKLVKPEGMSPRAEELIVERIKYLRGLISNKELNILDVSEEEQSIQDANAILGVPTDESNKKTKKQEELLEAQKKAIEEEQRQM
jgi:hypothetical protein